jgi:hypothetical protein
VVERPHDLPALDEHDQRHAVVRLDVGPAELRPRHAERRLDVGPGGVRLEEVDPVPVGVAAEGRQLDDWSGCFATRSRIARDTGSRPSGHSATASTIINSTDAAAISRRRVRIMAASVTTAADG